MKWGTLLRRLCALPVLLAAFLALSPVASAATGEIVVTPLDARDQSPVAQTSFTLYAAATPVDGGRYVWTDPFAGCGIDVARLTGEDTAGMLADFARQNAIPGQTQEANETAAVRFTGLAPGGYLVVQEGRADGYCPVEPFVAVLPAAGEDGRPADTVRAFPKAEPWTGTGTPVSLTVNKRWECAKDAIPAAITVTLLRDGKPSGTATLSAGNGWSHTWEELSPFYEWDVREDNVPKGFAARYARRGNTVTVTNAATLIQTGQTVWPIPVLAVGGLALLLAGGALTGRGKRRKTRKKTVRPVVALGALLIVASIGWIAHNCLEDERAGRLAADALAAIRVEPDGRRDVATAALSRDEPVRFVQGQAYLGTLSIPALELDLPVMEDWSYERLQTAPCRYSGTARAGDLVIAGHNYSRHFGRLSSLRIGDAIRYTDVSGQTYDYLVVCTEWLDPDQVEDMCAGEWDLTLYTCTLDGTRRVTVRAERTDAPRLIGTGGTV
ncbi:MAG: sortase [Acutalibacteraceae bacterium]|jgi:sortase A